MFDGLATDAIGVIVIAGIVVREATQLVIDALGEPGKKRSVKVLISIVFALIAAGLVHLTGWQQWSEGLLGGIWAASWGAQALKTVGNGGGTTAAKEGEN